MHVFFLPLFACLAAAQLAVLPEAVEGLAAAPKFCPSLISSFLIITISEIGDKTFFIAAILSMKHQSLVVFAGAFTALFIMTLLSGLVGQVLPVLLNPVYTHHASTILFAYFGVRLLVEGYHMPWDKESEELAAAEEELEDAGKKTDEPAVTARGISISLDEEIGQEPSGRDVDPEAALPTPPPEPASRWGIPWPTMKFPFSLPDMTKYGGCMQACSMTFLAEWGDRSQISTIALAASEDFLGVMSGALLGHFLCSAVAVLGGRFLASRISEKTVTLIGGCIFLGFALAGVLLG